MSDGIALYCQLFPASASKQDRILNLLRNGAREYYRKPEAHCTTWTYFVPITGSKKPNKSNEKQQQQEFTVGGLEIYTNKFALSLQLEDEDFFQAFHETVKKEDLYSKPESLVAWYQCHGFVAREQHAAPFGDGVLVSTTFMTFHDVEGTKKVLDLLSAFAPWVKSSEPDVLTYVVFTRPKAHCEILVFARYRAQRAMLDHAGTRQHVELMDNPITKGALKHARTKVWKEVEDSFVSNIAGGQASPPASRL